MATTMEWIKGARPKTLAVAVVPVAVGTAVATFVGTPLGALSFWFRAMLAFIVSLALQVAVNYANDYSDGIRGTDKVRVGPVRLVGQGIATPSTVKKVAWASCGVAALAGLLLTLLTQAWWLLIVGAIAICAAWFYTSGPSPYGYAGIGEVSVFVFFGLVAVTGTTFVLTNSISWLAVVFSVPVGLWACALLVVNNLRDIAGDTVAGKRTLAVWIGDARTRQLYSFCVLVPFLVVGVIGICGIGTVPFLPAGALLALIPLPLAALPLRRIRRGDVGLDLVKVLHASALLQLGFGLLLAVGIALSS